jgi:2-polyprenyl-6-methoxyphenol hydroxylase-like FAD-dependent oxidoreductase
MNDRPEPSRRADHADTYDAVVVGARVAGAANALLLSRAGMRVALVDRAAHGTDTVSTHGLMRAGVLQLHRWGVLPEVVAAGTPPIRRTVFHYGRDETVQISIRPSVGVDALYAPRRRVLDRILVDAAAAAGAHVLHRTTVLGLRTEGGRVRGVRVRDAGGRTRDLRAEMTIGADGLRSTVAEAVGAPVQRRGTAGGAVLYRYHASLPSEGYVWAYRSGSAAGLIPTNDGLTCVFVGTTPERMRALRRHGREHAFRTLFATAAPGLLDRLDASTPAERMAGWAGLPGFVRRAWGPGWALVGDAGYFRDPITTHGMTDALRDAELLGRALLRPGGLSRNEALRAFQERRDALSARLFDVTDRVARFDWDLAGVQRLLRELSSAMADEVELLERLPPLTPQPEGAAS